MAKAVIQIKDLKKYFGKVKAVDGISFDVKKGEILGFLGPNGAGKTTTIRCIMDFIHPTGGSIKILGQDHHKSSVSLKNHIGYLSGEIELYGHMKVHEYLNYILELHGEKTQKYSMKYIPYIKQFDLEQSLRKKIKTLSRGNKQKVGVVAAIMVDPDILIMDEPTSGLDPLMQEEFYKILSKMRKEGKTIFMSSHILSEVEKVCDRAAIIKAGKVLAIENITELHKKGLVNISVKTKEKIQEEQFKKIESVSEISKTNIETKIVIKGSPNKVIKELAKYTILRIEIKHADLEEVFMEFYS